MNKVILFECGICSFLYNDEETATNCESKGVEEPLAALYQDVWYRDHYSMTHNGTAERLTIYGIHQRGHTWSYDLGYIQDEENSWYYPVAFVDNNEAFKQSCTPIELKGYNKKWFQEGNK